MFVHFPCENGMCLCCLSLFSERDFIQRFVGEARYIPILILIPRQCWLHTMGSYTHIEVLMDFCIAFHMGVRAHHMLLLMALSMGRSKLYDT
jgi:hypothetical protein